MIFRFILIAAVLIAFFTLWQKIKKADPKKRKSLAIKIVIGVVIIAVILGAFTGRVHWLGAIAALLVPLAKWGMRFGLPLSQLWLKHSGGNARFSTPYLRVNVNVKNGAIQGEVIDGPHQGCSIENLSEAQIDELLTYYQDKDKKSYYLMRAVQQRRGFAGAEQGHYSGQNNGQHHDQSTHMNVSAPAREQALEILGLQGEPSRKDIITAHRRLINKLHPDRGGNDFLAAQVNQARDELLKYCPKD